MLPLFDRDKAFSSVVPDIALLALKEALILVLPACL